MIVFIELYFFGRDSLSSSIGYFIGVKGAVLCEVACLWEVIFDVMVLPLGVGVRVNGVFEIELLFPPKEVKDSLAVSNSVPVVMLAG
jgi:hypothetical protein